MSDGREVVFGTLNGCPVRCTRQLASRLGVQLDETEPPRPKATPAEVRAWASDNDVDCPTKGRIPAAVMAAYEHAHL
jgi:hypothetical protein